MTAIEIDGLAKRYGSVMAVDGLGLDVAIGETLALLGPNGAGKTTTVECCEGYRRPDEGTVRVLGLDPMVDRARLAPRIGVMLQESGVYPTARPGEVLRLFAGFFRDPLSPATLMEALGLAEHDQTRFRDLSGGLKQRLSLALALVGRPEVLFLDEPTAGLDPAARRLTWQLLRELKGDGVTIILTTHLLDEAEYLADRVAIIDRGRLVALGTPHELTHGSHAEITFTAPAGLDVAALAERLGRKVREHRTGHYRILSEADPRLIADLATWLADHDIPLGDLQAHKQSLEDVFLRLTSEDSSAVAEGASS
ncbi:MAG: ABC transporter ATP-binding protein [Nitriliruptorales bacterium]|nr:ABC transporter ATP-binding protein [Nitriliruptorales bacterium]